MPPIMSFKTFPQLFKSRCFKNFKHPTRHLLPQNHPSFSQKLEKLPFQAVYTPKIKMAPENMYLEMEVPFGNQHFQGSQRCCVGPKPTNPICRFVKKVALRDSRPPLATKSLELFDWLSWRKEMRVVSLCVFGETPIEQKQKATVKYKVLGWMDFSFGRFVADIFLNLLFTMVPVAMLREVIQESNMISMS